MIDAPYRVETSFKYKGYGQQMITEYTIYRNGVGPMVHGTDLAFMHKVIDLLNEDANGRDVHR